MQISEIVQKIKKFNEKRGWDEKTELSETARSVVIEAAELLTHFQWEGASKSLLGRKKPTKDSVDDEIADVFIYLARLSYFLDIDLEQAILAKMKKNAKRFPIK